MEVGLLVWGPPEIPMYNIDTSSNNTKGQNIWYHPPGKIPKPVVVLTSGDKTTTILLLNEDLPYLLPIKHLSYCP